MEHAHRQAARGVSACEKHTLDVHDRGPVLGAGGTGICDHIPQWGCGARLPRQLRAVHMRRLGGVSPRVAFGIPGAGRGKIRLANRQVRPAAVRSPCDLPDEHPLSRA